MRSSKLLLALTTLLAANALAADDRDPATAILPGSTLEFTSAFVIPIPQGDQIAGDLQLIKVGESSPYLCRFQLAKEFSPKDQPMYIDAGSTRTVTNTLTHPKGVNLKPAKRGEYSGSKYIFSKDHFSTGNEYVEFKLRADGKFSLLCYDVSVDKAWNRSMPTVGDVKSLLKQAGIQLQVSSKTTEEMKPVTF